MFKKRRDAGQWLERGRTFLLQGKGSHAESAFGHVLQEQPRDLGALKGLMEAWLLQGKSHGVIEHFDSLPRVQQERWHELLLIALAMQVGHLKVEGYLEWLRLPSQVAERLEGLRELAGKYTKCGALAIQWVEAALITYNIEEANHGLRQLRDAEPRVSPKLIAHLYAQRDALLLKKNLDVAEALHAAAQLESSEERLDILLPWSRKFMSLAPLQRDVGIAYFEQSRPDIAMRYLNRAVNANPYWVNAWVELGLASMAALRLVRAREALFRVMYLSDSPWIGDLHQEIEIKLIESPELSRMEPALDRLDAGDPAGAIEPLQRAMEINDKRYEIHWLMGRAYHEMGELGRATSYLRDALRGLPADEKDLRPRVQALLEKNLHTRFLKLLADDWAEEAVDLLGEALALGVRMPLVEEDHRLAQRVARGALSAQAVLAYNQGRPREDALMFECLPHLRRALSLDPGFAEARLAQAALLGEAGDLEMAWEEMVAIREDVEPRELVLFHLAGVAFLLQDLETAEKLWQHCAESTVMPWSHLAAENILGIHSGADAMLTTIALPTYQQAVEFFRAQDIGITPSLPSRDDILFEISPSAEMNAAAFPLEQAIAQAAATVPRLSSVAPVTRPSAPAVLPPEPAEKDTAEEVLQETEELSDVALFDRSQKEGRSDDPAFPFRSSTSSIELPSAPAPDRPRPLFEISPSAEIDTELSVEQLQAKAAETVPRLSQLAPSSSEEEPSAPSEPKAAWQRFSKPMHPAETSADTKPAPPSLSDPTQRDTLPLGAPESATPTTEPSPEPSKKVSSATADLDLFNDQDDLESFLDDAFGSLETKDESKK